MGKAYCFLILYVSKLSRQPSKERLWFEVCLKCLYLFQLLYSMVKEIAKDILNMTVLHSLLDSELDRLFRSDLFSKRTELDAGQLTLFIFNRSGKSQQIDGRTRKQSVFSRKKSIQPPSTGEDESEGFQPSTSDWKSELPDSALAWLSLKASENNQDSKTNLGNQTGLRSDDSLNENSLPPSLMSKRCIIGLSLTAQEKNVHE